MRTTKEIEERLNLFKDLKEISYKDLMKLEPGTPEWNKEHEMYYLFKERVNLLEWVLEQ